MGKTTTWLMCAALTMACGDDTIGTVAETSGPSTEGTDTGAETTTVGTTVAESSSGSASDGSTDTGASGSSTSAVDTTTESSSSSESSTTEGEPQTCVTLGCPIPEQWCVTWESSAETGGGDMTSDACVDLPPECVGLTGDALVTCLEPLCCEMDGCPQDVDEAGQQLECHSSSTVGCGFCE
jgi:hypothetical protein